MKQSFKLVYFVLLAGTITFGCKSNIKQQDDKIYSRHLQRHVLLTIISTRVHGDKSSLNLLLLNDGQETGQSGVKDGIKDAVDDTKDLIEIIKTKIFAHPQLLYIQNQPMANMNIPPGEPRYRDF
ncbi:MAG: hypothetical protein H7Z13_04710 [Ferruginibacter sp.]|nr:hypothetical protein [Ferruginibacter sp.]